MNTGPFRKRMLQWRAFNLWDEEQPRLDPLLLRFYRLNKRRARPAVTP